MYMCTYGMNVCVHLCNYANMIIYLCKSMHMMYVYMKTCKYVFMLYMHMLYPRDTYVVCMHMMCCSYWAVVMKCTSVWRASTDLIKCVKKIRKRLCSWSNGVHICGIWFEDAFNWFIMEIFKLALSLCLYWASLIDRCSMKFNRINTVWYW